MAYNLINYLLWDAELYWHILFLKVLFVRVVISHCYYKVVIIHVSPKM